MSNERNEAKRVDAMTFGCCGPRDGDTWGECWCASIMRRHRFFTSTMLAVMGLAALAIPVAILLGIIAFFRTL